MADGALPDQEMCEHCTSWGPDTGYPCHECGAMWPHGGRLCPKGHAVNMVDVAKGYCSGCDERGVYEPMYRPEEFVRG